MSTDEVAVVYSKNDDGSFVNGAQVFYEMLDAFDIRDATGYSGGNVLPLIDAFANPPKCTDGTHCQPIHLHMHANESCAGHSATAMARTLNHVGVCIVTSGPGITNCVTPIKDAAADSAPVLFISGQVAQKAMGHESFQEVDAVAVTTPVTKWSHLISDIKQLAWTINRAFKVMLNERPGPVHLDVPKDILTAKLPMEFDPFIKKRFNRPPDVESNPLGCTLSRSYINLARSTKVCGPDGSMTLLKASRGSARTASQYDLNEPMPAVNILATSPHPSPPTLAYQNSDELMQNLIRQEYDELNKDVDELYPDSSHNDSTNTLNLFNVTSAPGQTENIDGNILGCAPDIALNIPKLIALLKMAKKPIIHVGNGAKAAASVVRQLIKHLHIPATCTMHGLGVISAEDPLMLHWIGMNGAIYANKAIMASDLIINLGARFDDRSIGSVSTFGAEARRAAQEMRGGIVHVDISSEQFGKSGVYAHLNIRADVGVVASQLLSQCPPMIHDQWVDQVMSWKVEFPMTLPVSKNDEIYGPHIVDAVNRWCKKSDSSGNTIITTGVGNHQMYACQFYDYVEPNQLCSSGGLGTMGVGLPFAIGAAIANPQCQVVNFDGDGSFNMTYNDLSTLMRYKTKRVKIFIFNDSHLSMVAMWQEFFNEGREFIVDNTNPDYVLLGAAHGIKAIKIDNINHLDDLIDEAMSHHGPCLVDCRVLKGHVFPLVIPGTSLNNQYHDLEHMLSTMGSVNQNISPG